MSDFAGWPMRFVVPMNSHRPCPLCDGGVCKVKDASPCDCLGELTSRPGWCPIREVVCTDIAGKKFHGVCR